MELNAQECLNELCDFLLGKDYYIADPISNFEANKIIVKDIKKKYDKCFTRRRVKNFNKKVEKYGMWY